MFQFCLRSSRRAELRNGERGFRPGRDTDAEIG